MRPNQYFTLFFKSSSATPRSKIVLDQTERQESKSCSTTKSTKKILPILSCVRCYIMTWNHFSGLQKI